jgi:hypothetical protein
MPDDQEPVQVDLTVQRVMVGTVPDPELLEMLEMDDRPCIILAEIETIEKVDVDRRSNNPVRRE